MSSLFLQPIGSIEQKIESIVSGMCWANQMGYTLNIYWWVFPSHCQFDRCFRKSNLPSWVNVTAGCIEQAQVIKSPSEYIEKNYPSFIRSKNYFFDRTSELWYHSLRMLIPSPEIQQRLTMIPTKDAIGIYIHDQPDDKIGKVLSTIWSHYRDEKFFLLSTNSKEVKRFFELMLPNRLFTIEPNILVHTEKYIIDRLVDFFAFSRCKLILDASDSSLCTLAADYGGIVCDRI